MDRTDRLLREVAASRFGIEEFREGQLEAMEAAAGGRDVLAVMPTGHGKSAIYQVVGAALPGTAVVVSPLIALQHDQVEAINEDLGTEAAFAVNSRVGARRERAAWAAVEDGQAKFMFLAPEQLAREETVERLAAHRPSLFVVDEAHCISSWGHDFRPDYLVLSETVERLGHPPVVALTATASPHTRAEIVDRLGMRDPLVIVQSFDRPNIELRVVRHHEAADKRRALLRQVEGLAGPGLVYVATRRETEEYAAELRERGVRAEAYHAGRRQPEREDVHARFLDNALDVVVATTAFGMGIDKPDVRFVVHADIPDSLDSYYQQIGRAGRDGAPALAELHYRSEDLGLQQYFAGAAPDPEDLEKVFRAVRREGPVRARELREHTGLGPRAQARALHLLEHSGGVRARRRGYRAAPGAEVGPAVAAALEEAESQHRIDRSRIEMMRGYAETDGCRRDWLLNYFGEETDGWCGNCDQCEEEGSAAEAEERAAATPHGWEIQTPVAHREWGHGIVMGAEPDRITVLFDSVGYKELSLRLIEEQDGLLVHERAKSA
ncbi:ATP-dependent DNA helicase RecQ [Kocuria sp. SM24M-10]|uniref:RecQ family ATP-dependent DNA helicase n=1 Tax=Kocuria sp. SM24M-10 TaxID=1660349 RepID=UPI00064A61E3|nr:RecQ family ATP-dependent DNA helicase [Kocuria sp. SM24M-10]KLU11444.1 ATP-dependent DNA helicase RecQ [Kocuria sp. SM24M-10]